MYTLVGGQALSHWFPDAPMTSDWDYFTPCEVGSEPEHPGGILDVFEDPRLGTWNWGEIATPDELYTIKVSHMFWQPNKSDKLWDKHFSRLIFIQRKGAKLIRPLYDILLPIWKQQYNKKSEPNLTKNKAEFFKDAVVRKYDHDSLHDSVAYRVLSSGVHQPWFELILKPGSEVDVDWNMFQLLTPDAQLEMIREEIYVTALERLIIPADYNYDPRKAYHWALRRCITSLFKNEWALWIVTHLDELRRPDVDFVQRHRDNAHLLIPNP